MKKKFVLFLFFLIAFTTFSASIKKIRVNNYPPQLVFEIDSKVNFNSSYDEYNRFLFIEVDNATLATKINTTGLIGKNIEKFDIVDYGKNTGFFIKIKKGSGHKIFTLNKPFRIVVDFKPPNTLQKEFTIAIDAGHGGKDPGAIGFNKYKEKDITLAVAKKLKTKLSKDFNIVMIRETDIFIPLSTRSKIANVKKADLFVSLHANAAPNSTASGTEIFYFSKKSSPYAEKIAAYENSFGDKYGEKTTSIAQIMGELAYNKNMEKSMLIAKPLNTSLSQRLKMKDRGIYGANFAVLRGFNGPGILVELGFVTNKDDVLKMTKESNQDIMASELANKIRSFFY